ncbi:unnamed protein product [Protopolystoma xenopodis]|uniref:Uncharacterized protein n=1 Tax=Protopolystoma xenopodis TaxID=117903 RepID=A0A3S5AFM9_9PLAT|nr:unnamed protein product [Protopolystoma xenopodis]
MVPLTYWDCGELDLELLPHTAACVVLVRKGSTRDSENVARGWQQIPEGVLQLAGRKMELDRICMMTHQADDIPIKHSVGDRWRQPCEVGEVAGRINQRGRRDNRGFWLTGQQRSK